MLCCDCHVLFAPGVIARLKQFYREHPACQDLLQGPLLYDDGKRIATHMDPVWRNQMWGRWGSDPRGQDPRGEPFEIPMQGLGVFSCLQTVPGSAFIPHFGALGEKKATFMKSSGRLADAVSVCPGCVGCIALAGLAGVMYPLMVEEKLRNYVLGHAELGLDLVPVLAALFPLPATGVA